MDGGFGSVDEGVDEGALSRVLSSQDEQGLVFELALGPGLVEELAPHGRCLN